MKLAKELKQSTKDNQVRRLKKHLLWKNKDGVKSRENDKNALDRLAALGGSLS